MLLTKFGNKLIFSQRHFNRKFMYIILFFIPPSITSFLEEVHACLLLCDGYMASFVAGQEKPSLYLEL